MILLGMPDKSAPLPSPPLKSVAEETKWRPICTRSQTEGQIFTNRFLRNFSSPVVTHCNLKGSKSCGTNISVISLKGNGFYSFV